MEVLESGEQNLFQWDRKLSELSEPVDSEALLYNTDVLRPTVCDSAKGFLKMMTSQNEFEGNKSCGENEESVESLERRSFERIH